MDERHLWFASKLQETFNFGGYDNPTLLEDFFSEPEVGELISQFLSPGEPHKLFFYCNAAPPSSLCSPTTLGQPKERSSSPGLSRNLYVVPSLNFDVLAEGCVCLYILRMNTNVMVDTSMKMEKELFCGEIKHSVLSSLVMLLTEAYLPLLHSQVNWGLCSDDTVANFLQNFTKCSRLLCGVATNAQMKKHILQRPSKLLLAELNHLHSTHHRGGGGNGSVGDSGGGGGGSEWAVRGPDSLLKECDHLVNDWAESIESLMIDVTDDRLEDAHGSLSSEQSKWQRRHNMILSLSDQLRSMECRKIVTALFTFKSKLTKRWKAIDIQVTEVMNSARDHLSYCDVFSTLLEVVESRSPPSPAWIETSCLPSISAAMMQKEGMSRTYARSGFLDVVLTKLSSTLVRLCLSNLESFCCSNVGDQFWEFITDAILFKAQPAAPGEVKGTLKGCFLLSKLESFLQLGAAFRDFVAQTKHVYLSPHGNFNVSSLATTPSNKKVLSQRKGSHTVLRPSNLVSDNNSGLLHCSMDKVLSGMNEFTSLVSKVLELISTLAQFTKFSKEKKVRGLPRFSGLWTLEFPRSEEGNGHNSSMEQSFDKSERTIVPTQDPPDGETVSPLESISNSSLSSEDCLHMVVGGSPYFQQHAQLQQEQQLQAHFMGTPLTHPPGLLSTLKEESWVASVGSSGHQSHVGIAAAPDDARTSTVISTSATPSITSQHISGKVHWTSSDSLVDSVGVMVQVSLKKIMAELASECGGGVMDIFGVGRKNKAAVFAHAHQNYSISVACIDANICSYLKALFYEGLPTKVALDIIPCFDCMSSRLSVKGALDKCMVSAFSRYGIDLEEVQNLYEKDKGCPNMYRSAPPVARAVQWTRHLLAKVQTPMETFRKNVIVMQSMESEHICRLHNRLATALLKYESLWLNRWKTSVEAGHSALKTPLLVLGENNAIKVNCSPKMLELFSECKGLLKLGIPIPKMAQDVLNQESRVKQFKQQLEHILQDFYSIKSSIQPQVLPLFSCHVDAVIHSMLPALTTLIWSTMNIDAFLHKVQGNVENLRSLATRVGAILQKEVYGTLKTIEDMSLFGGTLATSRMWNIREFAEIMSYSVMENSNKLLSLISTIHNAILEIIAMTAPQPNKKQMSEFHFPLPPMARKQKNRTNSGRSISERCGKQTIINISNKCTPLKSVCEVSCSTRRAPSTGRMVVSSSPPQASIGDLDPAGERAIMYFCEVTLDVVQAMALHSHRQFSSSLAASECQSKEDKRNAREMRKNRTVSFNTSDSPMKVVVPAEMLRHDLNSRTSHVKSNKLTSSSSMRSVQVDCPLLRLVVDVSFSIPAMVLSPDLSNVQSHVMDVSSALLDVLKKVKWWLGPSAGKSLYEIIEVKGIVKTLQNGIFQAIQGLSPSVAECLKSLHFCDFLCLEDLHSAYKSFLATGPTPEHCLPHVNRFMDMESRIEDIPSSFTIGPLRLSTKPAKSSLMALAVSWKMLFSATIYTDAKKLLDELVSQQEAVMSQLQQPVENSLAKLRDVLLVLNHITDLQNVVDDRYLRVEQQYALLSEVQKVDALREQWVALTVLADTVRSHLLRDKKLDHEGEVDRQVKSFGVETIRFRNSFDLEGPLVPGLHLSDAVSRLGTFLDRCKTLKSKKELLDSVQKLLNLPLKSYPELDQTEQDLSYLRALYENYQQFIAFDKRFRQELWTEVDLNSAQQEVQGFWSAYKMLPTEQQEWYASRNLQTGISQYMETLPLLLQLHSKEIRNRHWLQIMRVVNCSFQLEGSVFRMAHLMDSSLLLCIPAIQEIINGAKHELHLEEKLYSIEEEWSEQTLVFQQYKTYGFVLLGMDHTYSLLERLEHVQMELATMLMSRYIQPIREEATQWTAKLASLSDILQQWLFVQKLWNNLEAMFDTPGTALEFQDEAVKFSYIHKRWLMLMKRAHATKTVLLCCCFESGEGAHSIILTGIREELEHCKSSLNTYLQTKREAFPRFFYVSDDSLLSILSNSKSVSSIRPHLVSVFGSIGNLLIDPGLLQGITTIIAVESVEGECLNLISGVPLISGVEQWTNELLSSIQATLRQLITSPACSGGEYSLEQVAHSQVSQVATMALYFQWCRVCENALFHCCYDRRALIEARSKFISGVVNKLVALLMRNSWKIVDEALTPVKRASLEALVTFSVWLKDMLEDLCHRKLRGIGDFEWQRFIRPYRQSHHKHKPQALDVKPQCEAGSFDVLPEEDEKEIKTVVMHCLDQEVEYGYEYLGCSSIPVFDARGNNYIIALTQSFSSHLGSLLAGPVGSGMVELIKGIGKVCGRNIRTLQCLPLMYGASVLRTMEGITREGSWACFSEVDKLSLSSLSILSQMMQIVTNALQSEMTVCTLPSTKQITIRPGLALFLTCLHATPHIPQWTPPPSMAPLLRTFSFLLPDPTLIIRSQSTALGLKRPKALANKLVTLQIMAREQLSGRCPQALVSSSTICHILKVASRTIVSSRRNVTSGNTKSKQSPDHTSMLMVHASDHHSQCLGLSLSDEARQRKRGSDGSSHMSPTIGQSLPVSVLKEHALIAQLVLNIVGSRLPNQELALFTGMIKDVFSGSLEVANLHLQHSICPLSSPPDFFEKLKMEASKAGLVPSQPWMCKVEQLCAMAQLRHAVILLGHPATGKSTALNTVVSVLNAEEENSVTIKLSKVYPKAVDNLSELFGCVDSTTGDWEDGIFTSIFRKAHQATQSVTWQCMDGLLEDEWGQYLAELLAKDKVFTLSNGEQLKMNESSFKLIFETGSLDHASPALLLDIGVVYFGTDVLGWRPVVTAWLSQRGPREAHTLLKYFEKIMDIVVEYIGNKVGKNTMYSEVTLLEDCLAFLSTLLKTYNETAEVFSEVHIERLLLFSVIWSYGGGLVGGKDQLNFSYLLKTLTNSLPDDDSHLSVFDYYVDESGDWDVWQSRVPLEPELQVDMLGSVFVDTVDTIRVEVLLDLALASRRHTLIVGPHGSGKTTIFRHFLQSRVLPSYGGGEVFKQLVLSGYSTSDAIFEFMNANLHHRQGFTYGPAHGKLLECFIDDLHLPLRHTTSPSSCSSHEYLRQLADLRGMFSLQRRNEWCTIEDLVLFCSATGKSEDVVSPRLRRHLAIIHLPEVSAGYLKMVASLQMSAFLSVHCREMESKRFRSIVEASTELYTNMKEMLRVSDTPGRFHYFFSLKHLLSVFQGVCQCISDGLSDKLDLCWIFEAKRAFTDGICRDCDRDWMLRTIDSIALSKLSNTDEALSKEEPSVSLEPFILSAFSPEVKQGDAVMPATTSSLNILPQVNLFILKAWNELRISVSHYVRRYREEKGKTFDLDISDNNLQCLVQLHRSLMFPIGSTILVGALGQQLNSIASLALFLAGYDMLGVDFSKETTFRDGMKSLFRQAGLGGKPIGVILTESDLGEVRIVQEMNSIIATGEFPTLFSNDDLEGLLQALGPSIKRDFPSEETDPMQYFIARVFRNIRFIFCLSPSSPLLGSHAHDYKGLLQGTHTIWMCDWTNESLMNSTSYFFTHNLYATEIEESLRVPLMKCLSSIHSFVLQETGQLLQAGKQPNYLAKPGQHSMFGSLETTSDSSSFTYEILLEKLLELNVALTTTKRIVMPYVGHRTLLQFLECFCEIFHAKYAEAMADKSKLIKVLAALHNTHEQVMQLKTRLKELRQHHDHVSKLAGTFLNSLTSKSCQLENLKAVRGESSSVYSAMLMVSEQERKMVEADDDDELLVLCMNKKASRLEDILQKARDHVRVAKCEEMEAKISMNKSKEVAEHWHSKIDRNTIDQIKSLNNPPHLVGTIMELILTLLNQYGMTAKQNKSGSTPDNNSFLTTPGRSTTVSSKMKQLSSSANATEMEKEQWHAIQIAIGDSQKFLDMLKNLKWEEGLSTNAVNLILSKLAVPGKNVPLDFESKIGGSDGRFSTSPVVKKAGIITVSMARYAAESAALMCNFAKSIVEYNDMLKPHKLALEKLTRAESELQEMEASLLSDSGSSAKLQEASLLLHKYGAPFDLEDVTEEAESGEEMLEVLQMEVDELQESFDKHVMEKYSIAQTCQQVSEKLKSDSHLLDSLKERQETWQSKLDLLPTTKMLAAKCILAAAITVYCGPLKTKARHTFFEKLLAVCRSQDFPTSDDHNLDLAGYPEFILGLPSLYKLVLEGLPVDSSSQQNAAILACPYSSTWPLVLDPLGMAEDWIRKSGDKLLSTKYQDLEMDKVLVEAMEKGLVLLISNVFTTELSDNPVLLGILKCRRSLHRSKHMVKMKISGAEVECDPSFRLVLISHDSLDEVPPEVASLLSTVVFHPEIMGIQQSTLDAFLRLQNLAMSHNREKLRVEMYSQSLKLIETDNELLEVLVEQENGHIEEPLITKTALLLNNAYGDALESLGNIEASYLVMNKVHLSLLQKLATQAGVIMATVWSMGTILPMYQMSYDTMLSVFLTFIEKTGSLIAGDSLMKMTQMAYHYFVKGYFEKDRHLFSFMLSQEIEISQGRATREEQKFLISPSPGKKFVVRGLTAQLGSADEADIGPTVQFGKKPFDWMSDSQWQMLLLLASRFSWVHSICDKLGKDGKDALWRNIGEGVAPENINLNERLGFKLLPVQQLLILSAMRPERIGQCMEAFVYRVLETGLKQKRVSSVTDLACMVQSIKSYHVPVILFRDEPYLAVTKLQLYASRMKIPLCVCYLHGSGEEEIESTKNALKVASTQGQWILLHNIQSCQQFLSDLPFLLEQLPERQKWEIWISIQGDCLTVPSNLLHSANKFVLDPPLSLCSSVLYNLSSLSRDFLTESCHVEWLPSVHNMAMLHATILLRKYVYIHALLEDFSWTHTHFMDAIRYMRKYFKDVEGSSKPVSWSGIRYMITEVIYGAAITDATSAKIFSALVEHWIRSRSPKKEVGQYHIPTLFFTPTTRLSGLLREVQNAIPPLVLTAEVCGLYFSPIIKLGWKDYLFPNLFHLNGYLQENVAPTFLPSCGMRRLQTLHGSEDSISMETMGSNLNVSRSSLTSEIQQISPKTFVITEKLPSFITLVPNLTEVHLFHLTSSVLDDLKCRPSLLKKLPLQNNTEKLVNKLPAIWKMELVSERLKKHGEDTPFGVFMKSEVSQMIKCWQAIQDNFKDLLVATTVTSAGDIFIKSPHLVNLALSVLTSTVPQHWLDLVGLSAPPSTWPLVDWLQDLLLRHTFLDRLMQGGLAKTATFWLGGFFNPAGFLNIIQQNILRAQCVRSGAVEQFVFQAELTNRDKDHIRDLPPEGELFIYGAYVWGCSFERATNGEFQDMSPKQVPAPLPVLHLTASILQKAVQDIPTQTTVFGTDCKGPYVFNCPCFTSNNVRTGNASLGDHVVDGYKEALFTVTMTNSEVTPARWATRNLVCTLRPF